ncbi:hypothetical protein O181_121974 [Austropuccinia psidii MF-1]|uniref:OTU domain-containing protein n=1 Tax=Austropuccinia psidii MF-1 TaxID=1389203 RepID=A0A9Q3Q1W0_9BASI|nr:hypothetical protein [Austropuccinia psidii MF-1]
MIESQSKRRGRPPSRSQSNVPSANIEVDSSSNSEYYEYSEDSEDSLSKSISSSDLLPSATESNKSEVTLRRSRRLAIGIKTSQIKSHKPATSLNIYDSMELNCEHCQSNYHTSDECSKLFVHGSEDLPNFIFKYTFKAINVQGDGNCGYRTVSHYIYKTQDQWADVRGDLDEEIRKNQDLYEAMNTLIPSLSSYLDRIEWYEDVGWAPEGKHMSMPYMGNPIVNKYQRPVFFYSTFQSFSFSPYFCPPNYNLPILICFLDSCSHFVLLDIIIFKVYLVPHITLNWEFHAQPRALGWADKFKKHGMLYLSNLIPPNPSEKTNYLGG